MSPSAGRGFWIPFLCGMGAAALFYVFLLLLTKLQSPAPVPKKPSKKKAKKRAKRAEVPEVAESESESDSKDCETEMIHGTCLVKYNITLPNHTELTDYKKVEVTIEFEDGVQEVGSLLVFPKVDGEEGVFNLSNNLKNDSIIKPRVAAFNEAQQQWLLIFEKFESLYDEWDARYVTSRQWWMKSIKKLLQTIDYMHSKGILHGDLQNPKSYAIQGGELHILITGSNPREISNFEKKQDFRDFKEFIKDKLHETLEDRPLFLGCFDKTGVQHADYVKLLVNHPFLMTPYQRLRLVSVIYQAHFGDYKKEAFSTVGTPLQQFEGWDDSTKIVGVLLKSKKHTEQTKGGNFDGSNVMDLVRLLRNVFIHHAKRNAFKGINTRISKSFPGLVSLLHEHVALLDEEDIQ